MCNATNPLEQQRYITNDEKKSKDVSITRISNGFLLESVSAPSTESRNTFA